MGVGETLKEMFKGYGNVAGGPYRVRAPQFEDASGPGQLYGPSLYEQSDIEKLSGYYFKGIGQMSNDDRQQLKQLGVYSDDNSYEDNNHNFKNYLFKVHFENAEQDWAKEVWNKRQDLTIDQRDQYFSKMAMEKDLDDRSILQETSFKWSDNPATFFDRISAKAKGSVREDARKHLQSRIEDSSYSIYEEILEQPFEKRKELLDWLDSHSSQLSQHYNYYNGTDKLELTDDDKYRIIAQYLAGEQIAGSDLADKFLAEYYQNTVANNQDIIEKVVNTGAGFTDNLVGNLAELVGMIYGAGKYVIDDDSTEFWKTVLENEVTQWANRLTTTNAWTTEEQERLLAMGMSDNAILNTVEQENSIFNSNTIFEVGQQLGYVAGSMSISKGVGATVKGLAKASFKTAKKFGGGRRVAEGIIKTRNAGYALTPSITGTVEGGMNALHTKNNALMGLNQQVMDKYNKLIAQDIKQVSPEAKRQMLIAAGVPAEELPQPTMVNTDGRMVSSYTKEDQQYLDYLIQATPSTQQQFMAKYQQQMDVDFAAAEEKATTAMYQDFVVNSTINGIVNTTLQATFESAAVRQRLGVNSPKLSDAINISKTADGWVATVNKANAWNVAKRRGKEALGEFIEEYSQNLSSTFAVAYANNSMQQYLDHKNGNTTGGEAAYTNWAESTAAGLQATIEQTTDFQAIKEGVYGALATAGPKINNFRGQKGKREDENQLQYILRRSPIDVLYSSSFSGQEIREMNDKRQQIADNVNAFLQDKQVQNKLTNSAATVSWMADLQTAIDNKDEKAARDNQLGAFVHQIMTLNSLQGTSYYTSAMATVEARASLDIQRATEEGTKEYDIVTDFMNNPHNRQQNLTREQAAEQIKSSASKLLSLKEQIAKETEQVNKAYGNNMDEDVKESLVFNRLVIQDYKKRAQSLDKEIQSVQRDVMEVSATPSQLGNKGKSIIAKYGSLNKAKKALEDLKSKQKGFEEEIKESKRELKTASGEEKLRIKAYIQESQKQVKSIKDQIKEISEGEENYKASAPTEQQEDGSLSAKQNVVISAAEIISMNPIDRATMLGPKNRNAYSAEQQIEIQKVLDAGISSFQDFEHKIKDRGLIERDYQGAIKQQYDALYDYDSLAKYAKQAKQKARERNFRKQHESLQDPNLQWEDFSERLDDIFNRQDRLEIKTVSELLKEDERFIQYKSNRDFVNSIMENLSRNEVFEDESQAKTFEHVLRLLTSRGIDPLEDADRAVEFLTRTFNSSTSNLLINDYLEKLEQNSEIGLQTAQEAVDNFKNLIDKYKNIKEEGKNNNPAIEVSNVEEESAPPTNPTTPVDAELNDVEDNKDKIVKQAKDKFGQEASDVVETIISAVSSWEESVASDTEKQYIKDHLEQIVQSDIATIEDLPSALRTRANKIDIQEDDSNVAKLLRKLAAVSSTRTAEIAQEKREAQERAAKRKAANMNVFIDMAMQRYGDNPNSSIMTSLSVAFIEKTYPNGSNARFLKQHKVMEFLQSGYLSENKATPIYFISDAELNAEIKESMGDSYVDNHRSLIAVIQHDEGTIEIGNKKYQVVAVMPTDEKFQGANRVNDIRSLIQEDKLGQLITDKDGKVLETTAARVLSEPYLRGDGKTYYDARDIIRDLLILKNTFTDNTDINNLSQSQQRLLKQELLSRIRCKKIVNKNGVQSKILQFKVSSLNGSTTWENIYIRNFDQIVGENGLSLFDMFKAGKNEAIKSHYRLENAAKGLKEFVKGFNNNDQVVISIAPDNSITLNASSQQYIESKTAELRKVLNHQCSLPQGFDYNIGVSFDGNQVNFSLNVTDGDTSIEMLKFNGGQELTEDQQFAAIRTLVVDESGNFRQAPNLSDKSFSFIKPQVDYPMGKNSEEETIINIDKFTENEKTGIVKALMSGTLGFNVSSVAVLPTTVEIRSPLKQDGSTVTENQVPPKAKVANDDNATSAEEGPAGPTGQSKPEFKNDTQAKAAEKVDAILKQSAQINLDDDNGDYYQDNENVSHIRVTRLISSDRKTPKDTEEGKRRLEAYSIPSTYIGNVLDNLNRRVFSGEITADNMDQILEEQTIADGKIKDQLRTVLTRVIGIKAAYERIGWTFVSGDVKVQGTVAVQTDRGKINVPVVGTLDLLAYDTNGNFHIIDFKTNRTNSNDGMDIRKRNKYNLQLSLYKKLLEQKHGVHISSLSLLVTDVEYPEPKQISRSREAVEYTKTESGEVLKDNTPFTLDFIGGAYALTTTYQEGILGQVSDIDIDFNSLSEADQNMIRSLSQYSDKQAQQQQDTVEEIKIENKETPATSDPVKEEKKGTPFIDTNTFDATDDIDMMDLLFPDMGIEDSNIENSSEENGQIDVEGRVQEIKQNPLNWPSRNDIVRSKQWNHLFEDQDDEGARADEFKAKMKALGVNSNVWSKLPDDIMDQLLKCYS